MSSVIPQRLDVYMVRVPLGHADYARPCILTDNPSADVIELVPLSTKNLEHFQDESFCISSEHPDFVHTGLAATSYVIGNRTYKLPAKQLRRRMGRLEGSLAREFEKWFGS